VADDLRRVAGKVDPVLAGALVDHADALAAGDAAGLDDVARRFDEAGFGLYAAEAADGAGVAHRLAGRRAAAERSAARAATLLGRCGGVRPPWLSPLHEPVPLTRREREVVNLAARGLSSSAIAERLFVATRTVEGHLLRAYQKLGVRNRAELTRHVKGATPSR
jgi:DNA-binding CsgD family transcriptional regulator